MVEQYDADQTTRLKTRVTYVAAAINIFLTLIKIGVGFLGQSAALIADGIHSLADLLSDLFVIIAIKMGSREADYDHPYGHRRFETIATVLLGMGLIVIAVGIAWDVSERLMHPEKLLILNRDPLGIAMISILANEWLYHYTKRIGKLTRSKLLIANAWHHRSDAISSVVVLFGIIAVLAGFPFADAVAAVIVALMVAKIGLNLVIESINELVDSSLPEGQVKEIRRVVKTTRGVKEIHLLRTRQMGEDAYVDAHIVVDPRITVSEGHMIGDVVRDRLKSEFDEIVDVLVHVDPEDDEFKEPGGEMLLTRKDVIKVIRSELGELFDYVDDIKLHYLDKHVEIEILLSHLMVEQTEKVQKIKQLCSNLEQQIEQFSTIAVYYKA